MSEETPEYVIEHVAKTAVKHKDYEVLMKLSMEGHKDIVLQAIRDDLGLGPSNGNRRRMG